MSTANDVQRILYDFTQRCFIGAKSEEKIDISTKEDLFEFLSKGELTVMQVHQMSKEHQTMLRELLTQHIMFLQMNQRSPFPVNFLSGSNHMVLGRDLLTYICQYRWPFPQLLKQDGQADA